MCPDLIPITDRGIRVGIGENPPIVAVVGRGGKMLVFHFGAILFAVKNKMPLGFGESDATCIL